MTGEGRGGVRGRQHRTQDTTRRLRPTTTHNIDTDNEGREYRLGEGV